MIINRSELYTIEINICIILFCVSFCYIRNSNASEKISRLEQAAKDITKSANDAITIEDDTRHEPGQEDKENEVYLYVDAKTSDEKEEKLAHPIPVSDDYLMPIMHDDGYLHPPMSQTNNFSLTETAAANYEDIPDVLNHMNNTSHSRYQDPENIEMDEKRCYEGLMTSNRAVTDTDGKIYQELRKTQ